MLYNSLNDTDLHKEHAEKGTEEMKIERSKTESANDNSNGTTDMPISKEEAVRLAILKTG